MTTEQQPVPEREPNLSPVALCLIQVHPAFGGGYAFQRVGLQLAPFTCQPTDLEHPDRYNINGTLYKHFEPLVQEFKQKKYPPPHFAAAYEGAGLDERGEFDVFSVALDYNTSGWLMTHLFQMRDTSIIILSEQDLKKHLETNQRYRVAPPNIGLGHLTVDPRCKAVLLPEKPQLTQSTRKPLERVIQRFLSSYPSGTEYRLQGPDFDILRKFVDPKIVDTFEKDTVKRRLMERVMILIQSLYEGLTVSRIQTQQPNRFNGLNFLLVSGLILTEALTEYYEKRAQKTAGAGLEPIIDYLSERYKSDARMHGLTPGDLSKQLQSIAGALAEAEGIPPQVEEAMAPTLSISGALALSGNYQLMSFILGSSIALTLYFQPLIRANPFRPTGDTLHLGSHFISALGRYLPAIANAAGLNLPETAVIAMVAGHHTENLSELSDIHAGRASLILFRELLRMFDLSIGTPALWKQHCEALAGKYSPEEIEAAVQKLQAEPAGSALFTGYSLGIEGNILLRNTELLLRPGVTLLELPQHAGLSRILGALSDRINHPRGIALQKNRDGSILDLHTGDEHPVHYERCGGVSVNDPIPSFHPSLSELQIRTFLYESGLFSQAELDAFELGNWTSTDSYFRKRYALAATGSHALFGSAKVLMLDNFDTDVKDASSWQSMIQFIQRLTEKGIPVLIGYHNDPGEHSNVYDARLDVIQNQGIPVHRYTVKGQKFEIIN